MSKIYPILLLLFFTTLTQAQIVINEIMYNPPESGTDYLEYIEFYNAGNSPVNLKNYAIKDAVVITFPDTILTPNSYFIICVNSQKFDSVFGFQALEWTSGGLRNTDEVITLLDSTLNPVDSVHYYSSWSGLTNGNGASLELCRVSADNNLDVYWRPSTLATGIELNNHFIFASPNKTNPSKCAEYTVNVQDFVFNPVNLEIYTGEQVEWVNLGGTHNINGSKVTFPSNPSNFGNGAPSSAKWSYIYRFDQIGVYNYQCDVHASSGMTGTVTVRNRDVNYPNVQIGIVTSTNINGVIDSLNKKYTVEGTVYGVNLRPVGLQFTIIDELNDGIAIFLSSGNLNYTVTEGDYIQVKGTINQFNGLAQMIPDSIVKFSSNHVLFKPTFVNFLNESTESQLIEMKSMELVDPVLWTNNPLGFTVKITNGVNTFDMRIDNDVNIHGTSAPLGKFDLIGLGSQFDAVNPFLEGYQIFPRYLADIKILVGSKDLNSSAPSIFPNPVGDEIQIDSDINYSKFEILDLRGNILVKDAFKNRILCPFPSGIYFIKLIGDQSSILRFVKI
ncbi:MAG: lamin tail domain-containing protein [Saprospiraceae bacterium]|nr:lamin tail domain-containing protein [Saprospiraceae bacterium]